MWLQFDLLDRSFPLCRTRLNSRASHSACRFRSHRRCDRKPCCQWRSRWSCKPTSYQYPKPTLALPCGVVVFSLETSLRQHARRVYCTRVGWMPVGSWSPRCCPGYLQPRRWPLSDHWRGLGCWRKLSATGLLCFLLYPDDPVAGVRRAALTSAT